jgi:hypothetical protein
MKKQGAPDAKRAAANDKLENGKAEKASAKKAPKPTNERYTIGSTDTVRGGFLKEFCDFTRKKGTVDAAMLIAEFNGRQIDGRKVTVERIHRYIAYSRNHGIIKAVK